MAYKIIVSPRAQKEIIKAIDYYSEKSQNAPVNFILQLEKIYAQFANNPYFQFAIKILEVLKLKYFHIHYIMFWMKKSKL